MSQPRKFSIRNDVGDVLALSEHRKTGIASINPKGLGIGFENTLENFGTAQIVKQRRAKLPDFEIDIVLGMNWSNATPRQLYMQIIQFFNKPPYTLIYENGNGRYLKDVELLDMPMTDIKESQTIQETLKFTQTGLWYQDTVFIGNDPAGARTEAEGLLYRQASKLTAADPDKLGRAYNIGGAEYQINDNTGLNLLDGTRDFSGAWSNSENWITDGTYKGLTVKKRTGQWGGMFKAFTAPTDGVYAFSAYIKSANGGDARRWINVNNVDISNTGLGSDFGWKHDIIILELKAGDVAHVRYEFQALGTGSTLWTAGHKWAHADLSGYNLLDGTENFKPYGAADNTPNQNAGDIYFTQNKTVTELFKAGDYITISYDVEFLNTELYGSSEDVYMQIQMRGGNWLVISQVKAKNMNGIFYTRDTFKSSTYIENPTHKVTVSRTIQLTQDFITANATVNRVQSLYHFIPAGANINLTNLKIEQAENINSTATPWSPSYSEIPHEWSPSEAELEAANSVGAVYSDNKVINGTGGVFDLHNDSIYFGLQDSSPLEIVVTGQGTNTTPNAIMKNPWWEIVDENGKVLATDMYLTDLLAVEQLVIRSGYGRNAAYIVNTETGARRDAYQLQDHSKTNFVQVPLGASQLRFHTTNNLVMKAGDIRLTMRKEYIAVG